MAERDGGGIRYEWPSELSDQDMLDIIDLMNVVAVRERTIGFLEPLSPEDGLALMRSYDADLRRGTVMLLAARTGDGRIVGMLTLARPPLPAQRHVVEMRRCVIAPKYRGQILLGGWEHALTKVRDLGCEIMTIEVRDDGPVELWRAIGFRDYGMLPDYARKDGKTVAGYFMYANCGEVLDNHARTGSWVVAATAPSIAV